MTTPLKIDESRSGVIRTWIREEQDKGARLSKAPTPSSSEYSFITPYLGGPNKEELIEMLSETQAFGESEKELADVGSSVRSLTLSQDKSQVFVGTWDGRVISIDLNTKDEVLLADVGSGVRSLTLSQDESQVIVGTADGRVISIDLNTKDEVLLADVGSGVRSLTLSQDESQLFVGTRDGEVISIDLNTKDKVLLADVGSMAWSLTLSQDESQVFVGTWVGRVISIDLNTKKEVVLADVGSAVDSLTLSQDGSQVFVGTYDGRVISIDLSTKDEVLLADVGSGVRSLTLSQDGSQVFVGTYDGRVISFSNPHFYREAVDWVFFLADHSPGVREALLTDLMEFIKGKRSISRDQIIDLRERLTLARNKLLRDDVSKRSRSTPAKIDKSRSGVIRTWIEDEQTKGARLSSAPTHIS